MDNFVLFGSSHFIILGIGVLVSFILMLMANFIDIKGFARFSAVIVLIIKITELIYRHYVVGEKIVNLLPLHLCNIVLIFVIIMMFTTSKILFQPCYFWSIGALFALITPDVKFGITNYATISFFITHFYIIFSVIYCYIFFKYRPSFLGYCLSFLGLNIICLIVYFINAELGTNYLFVNRVPDFTSPISYFGEWPYYIIVIELIYIILSYIMYFPFKAKSVRYGKENFY